MNAPAKLERQDGQLRHDWTREEISALFSQPFSELIWRAHGVHRANFDASEVQISTLLSIKTGGCPEDCAYCPQSADYDTGVKADKLMDIEAVLADARAAKDAGAPVKVAGFLRFGLGEGVEREEKDFAAEVAGQLAR